MSEKKYTEVMNRTRKCQTCGKIFYVLSPEDYVYKIPKGKNNYGLAWFCRYTCYRTAGGDGGVRIRPYANSKS